MQSSEGAWDGRNTNPQSHVQRHALMAALGVSAAAFTGTRADAANGVSHPDTEAVLAPLPVANRKLELGGERTDHPDAQWFPQAGLGLFLHWGIVSEFEPTGAAWAGQWTAEKAANGQFFPQTDIWQAAETFNPPKYDPNKWMEAAQKAGFEYAVLTTKHHDGYALWDSPTALIGVRQFMDGRDLVGPFVEACRRNDIKVGFYYSGTDWFFERETKNFSRERGVLVNYRGKIVDELPQRPEGFREAYDEYNARQVHELIKGYDPDLWWGDAGHGLPLDELRALSPRIVANNRGSDRMGDYVTPEGYRMIAPELIRPVVANGWWWEACLIFNGGSWHYSPAAETIRPTDHLLLRLAQIRSMGGNLLANLAPRPDGQLPEDAYRLFSEMAEWMETNRESVSGINGGWVWPERSNAPVTCRDRIWYVHTQRGMATNDDPVIVQGVPRPISVTLLRTGEALPFAHDHQQLELIVPDALKAGHVTDVVRVEFGEDFDPTPYRFQHW